MGVNARISYHIHFATTLLLAAPRWGTGTRRGLTSEQQTPSEDGSSCTALTLACWTSPCPRLSLGQSLSLAPHYVRGLSCR